MKKAKINGSKVSVTRIGYFGVESTLIVTIERALSVVEVRNNEIAKAQGINPTHFNVNGKPFTPYYSIVPYYGK